MAACAWQLWNAKAKATSVQDQWLVWSLLAVWIASVMSMFVVSLFGEMYFIYHMFLGLMANAPIMVGGGVRHVGVMAEVDGKPVLLRYALKQGQRLAIVRPGEPPVVAPGPVAVR
jgi:amino acid permease